jgi:hypothetical protein
MVQQYGEQCNYVRWCTVWRNDKNILNLCFVSSLWFKLHCALHPHKASWKLPTPMHILGRVETMWLFTVCLSIHTPCGKGARHKNVVLPRTLTWHKEQNLVPSHTAKYMFKWIQKWEKWTCYRKILRKYAIKEMDYAILNVFKCVAQKKMLGYNIYS